VKLRIALGTAATLIFGAACMDGYEYANGDNLIAMGPPVIDNADLRADLPGFVNTQGPATIESFEEPGFQQVTVTRNEANRQAMGIVFIEEGDFSNPIFTDIGRTTTFSMDRPTEPTAEPIVMSVIGCGGDPSNAWFDAPADNATVVVEEGDEPQDRVVTITSTYPDGGEVESQMLLTR
jgi:hypothetical protein